MLEVRELLLPYELTYIGFSLFAGSLSALVILLCVRTVDEKVYRRRGIPEFLLMLKVPVAMGLVGMVAHLINSRASVRFPANDVFSLSVLAVTWIYGVKTEGGFGMSWTRLLLSISINAMLTVGFFIATKPFFKEWFDVSEIIREATEGMLRN